MNTSIKVGMLVSFDWELMKNSLPLIYDKADLIILTIDKHRKTWAGEYFEVPESFFEYIKELDKDKKIKIFEDDFYFPDMQPMQVEIHTRNKMAEFMGKGGWHLQIDADEYFIDFPSFVKVLKRHDPSRNSPVNITCGWITLFKKLKSGYLIISHQKHKPSLVPIATNYPVYEYGRMNGSCNKFSGQYIIHDSWARSEEGLWNKLNNWGHKNDFDINAFFNFWKSIDETNYQNIKDFHPLQPEAWKRLEYISGGNVEKIIKNFFKQNEESITHSSFELFIRNSKVINKVKSLLK